MPIAMYAQNDDPLFRGRMGIMFDGGRLARFIFRLSNTKQALLLL